MASSSSAAERIWATASAVFFSDSADHAHHFTPENTHLGRPVVVVRCIELLFELLQLVDLGACLGCAARLARSQSSCPDCDRDDVRRRLGWRNDGDGPGPLAPLNDVTDGYRCRGIAYLEVARVEVRLVIQLMDDVGCVLIASILQTGVDEVVHGMQLFSSVALFVRGFSCGEVGCDGIAPHPKPREDVGQHVEGVRG